MGPFGLRKDGIKCYLLFKYNYTRVLPFAQYIILCHSIYYVKTFCCRFTLKTLKNFGFGKSTMENMITEDAIMLAKKIENIGNASTMNDFRSVVSVGVLNGLWALVTGSRYV